MTNEYNTQQNDNTGQGNWIKLHRKFLDWGWYQDTNTKVVFLHCLISANWQEKEWMGITIKRGQFVKSIANFYGELNKEGKVPQISTQNIRTAISHLKSTRELTSHKDNGFTVFTVTNYDKYQQVTSPLTNDQQTTNKRLTSTKEVKKEKNIISPLPPLLGGEIEKIEIKKDKTEVLAQKVLKLYSALKVGDFKVASFKNNLAYWQNHYTDNEILASVIAMSKDEKWGPILGENKDLPFRRRNKNQEDVDYIGQYLHIFYKKGYDKQYPDLDPKR